MLDPRLREKLAKGYSQLGRRAHTIATSMMKGKDNYPSQAELYKKSHRLRQVLKVLFRHVTFDSDNKPVLWNATELDINSLVRWLDRVGDIDKIPAVPTIFPTAKPYLINQGAPGTQGLQGPPGDDANIIVRPKAGETEVIVTEVIESGVKVYELEFNAYKVAALSVQVQGTKTYEKGVNVVNKQINFVTTKGSKNVTSLVILDPAALNPDLQGVLDLPTINGVTQPVTHFVIDALIQDTKNYIAQISDGITPVSESDTISFFYPFLFGATAGTSINTYTDLTKLIAGKANRSFTLNGTNKYFWIAYPSSYGALARIKDQNGFVVTDSFTTDLVNVTSVGLDVNWTVQYRRYRTIAATDVANQPYSIEF